MGRIQKRKTNLSKSSLSACNARPVHTDGPTQKFAERTRCALLPPNVRYYRLQANLEKGYCSPRDFW
jgi:hypothetical protein